VIDWVVNGLGSLFGYIAGAASGAAGWAWDKVTGGIYSWLANGLALLIQWVWGVLDSATTPHVTAAWFRNGLAARLGVIALAVTVAMMLASAIQAALAGRPEQILDAVREGARAVFASGITLTVIDVLIRITDEASTMVWENGRSDLKTMIERIVKVAAITGPLTHTFVGPLCLLLGFVGLLGLVVSLMMRSALIYVVAALAPVVWSSSVLPSMRGSSRKLVHLGVSLILSKLAIVITLVVAVKLTANAGTTTTAADAAHNGAAAVGMLVSGFVCFLVAAVTPVVLFKLMPTVEGALVASGIAGGWGRSVSSAASSALMVKSLGASRAASVATRAVAGQSGVPGAAGAGAATRPVETGESGGPGQGSAPPASTVVPAASSTPAAPATGSAGDAPSARKSSVAEQAANRRASGPGAGPDDQRPWSPTPRPTPVVEARPERDTTPTRKTDK
jgi:hypothetical protein